MNIQFKVRSEFIGYKGSKRILFSYQIYFLLGYVKRVVIVLRNVFKLDTKEELLKSKEQGYSYGKYLSVDFMRISLEIVSVENVSQQGLFVFYFRGGE